MKQREGRHAVWSKLDSIWDQCQFGTMLPDSFGDWMYTKKPTTLRWPSFQAAGEMTKLCMGDHEHLPIESSSPKICNRARASGAYQQGFCNAIFDTVCRIYEDEFEEEAYANNDVQPLAMREFPLESDEPEQAEEEQMSPVTDPVNPEDSDGNAP